MANGDASPGEPASATMTANDVISQRLATFHSYEDMTSKYRCVHSNQNKRCSRVFLLCFADRGASIQPGNACRKCLFG